MGNTVKKVYVDANGLVLFVCPNCGEVQKEQAQVYKDTKGPISIQCKCGNSYEVEVEFRKLFRKEAKLDGVYSTESNSGNWQRMIVENISMLGCGFETLKPNTLKRDEEIKIEFKLNNAKKSLIRRRAIVRSIYKNHIGCEFIGSPALDPDLGFYLRQP